MSSPATTLAEVVRDPLFRKAEQLASLTEAMGALTCSGHEELSSDLAFLANDLAHEVKSMVLRTGDVAPQS